jgi:hypothetical protein
MAESSAYFVLSQRQFNTYFFIVTLLDFYEEQYR